MNKINQHLKEFVGLAGAIGGSLLLSLSAIAQTPETSPTPDQQPTQSNTINSSTDSSPVLNPCPSVIYDPKYKDRVSIPASCPPTKQSNDYNVNSPVSPGLNPCPSIFYESKYKNTVGVPANCSAKPTTPSVSQ